MSYFDKVANNWDEEPGRLDRARKTFEEIRNVLQPNIKDFKCFEFGCGTALLSEFFCSEVKSIHVYDTSEGMLNVVRNRISARKIANINIVSEIEFVNNAGLNKYDLIYTLMSLHHVDNVHSYLMKLSGMLKNNGYLCIGDLRKEDGSFHTHIEGYNGYNGFEPDELIEIGKEGNLKYVELKDYYNEHKDNRDYPLFLLVLQKRK